MADKIILSLQIDGAEREIKNIKDLKLALRDAQTELLKFETGTAGFQKAQKNLAELKGKLNDLGDAARVEGTAAEQLSQRFSLLRESLATGDMDKAKLALGGIGSAMKAIPLIALVAGFQMLVENFGAVVAWGKAFFDIVSDSERAVAKLNEQLVQQQVNNKILIQSIEDEIGMLKAQGASEDEVIARKKQIVALKISEIETQILLNKHKLDEVRTNIELNDVMGGTLAVMLQMAGLRDQAVNQAVKVGKERQARERDIANQIKVDEATIAHLKASLNIEIVASERKKNEELKKLREEELEARKKQDQIDFEDAIKRADVETQNQLFLQQQEEQRKKDEEAAIIAEIFAQGELERVAMEAIWQAEREAEARHIERRLAIHAAFEKNKLNLATSGINAISALSNLVLTNQLNNVKKGSTQELALKKKQFEINKGIDIARAVIDGVRGVQAQLSAGPIVGPILAALVGITAAANVAKIKSTKFDGGDMSLPSIDIPTAAPSIPTPQTAQPLSREGNEVGSTRFNSQGQVIRAYVVETELSESQKNADRLKEQSKFG